MTRFALCFVFSLLAGSAGAQSLGYSPQTSPAMPGTPPATLGMGMPGTSGSAGGERPPSLTANGGMPLQKMPGAATPAPVAANPAPAAGGPIAGVVGMRGAMRARKGSIYQTTSTGTGVSTQAFMTIENQSSSPDTITSMSCTIATTTDLVGADGKSISSLPIGPNKSIVFAVKGVHAVLRDIHYTIVEGSTIPCAVTFQYAGSIQAYLFAVKTPAPSEP